MKNLLIILGVIAVFSFAFAGIAEAAIPNWGTEGLVTCSGVKFEGGKGLEQCTSFCDLLATAKNVLEFVVTLSLFAIAPIFIVIGGFMVAMGGANPKMHSKGVAYIKSVVIGIIIILVAFVLVNTFIKALNLGGKVGGFGESFECKLESGFINKAHAAEFKMEEINTNLPGGTSSTSPIGIISDIYKFALSISGILAVGVIIYGGVRYISSPGSPSGQSDAKEWIISALLGILLLAGAYFVLNIVNPELTILRMPELNDVKLATSTPTPGDGSVFNETIDFSKEECKDYKLSSLSPLAQKMEKGESLIWNSSTKSVDENLGKLLNEYNELKIALKKNGGTAQATSAYRPISYQRHFYELFTINKALQNDSSAECADLKKLVSAEIEKHGIQGAVAKPNPCAPHTSGKAIDISISGIPYEKVNAILRAEKVDLEWSAIPNDKPHFRLLNPPYASACASAD